MGKVEYSATRSMYNNCLCDACLEEGYVTKLVYPRTRYYDGKVKTQRHYELWICDNCKVKMIEALQNPVVLKDGVEVKNNDGHAD